MKFLLATKVEMTNVFDQGHFVPVSRVKAGPVFVTQVKTKEKDGVNAVQVGFLLKPKAHRSLVGHAKKAIEATGVQGKTFRYLKEFPIDDPGKFHIGQKLSVGMFQKGDVVRATGVSKGKGFQGVVRRHHFSGSPATHGHKDQLRMPGSIGSGFPQKVFKGKRMGGRMGGDQVTVRGLTVVSVDPEHDELLINGSLPGAPKSLLRIDGAGEITLEATKEISSEQHPS